MMAYAGELWLNWSYLHRDEVLWEMGAMRKLMDAKKVLVWDSGGKMTASEGVWWQNKGYWELNLVYF